uniref:Uncharacterized protein n=1 Tax=Coccidioides posadasii RMSCC 3488 TaxID=454284 RepID=A0A0J6FHA8_COCPO|nr:hypothetical protein CPAG_08830 [Coccidioides posadasii RMSCC 3488]
MSPPNPLAIGDFVFRREAVCEAFRGDRLGRTGSPCRDGTHAFRSHITLNEISTWLSWHDFTSRALQFRFARLAITDTQSNPRSIGQALFSLPGARAHGYDDPHSCVVSRLNGHWTAKQL